MVVKSKPDTGFEPEDLEEEEKNKETIIVNGLNISNKKILNLFNVRFNGLSETLNEEDSFKEEISFESSFNSHGNVIESETNAISNKKRYIIFYARARYIGDGIWHIYAACYENNIRKVVNEDEMEFNNVIDLLRTIVL